MNDARRRRKSIEYAQVIIRTVKSADISIYNQIFLIYNDLNLEFRKNLSLLIDSTNMNIFLIEMKNKKKI